MSSDLTVSVIPDSAGATDLQTTDGQNQKVVWPLPRSMKIDMATILIASLQHFGLGQNVKVVTTGSFLPAMMRSEDYLERTVVVLQRASDAAERDAIGELTDVFTLTDIASGRVLDPQEILAAVPDLDDVVMKDQVSAEMVDVWIFDENDERAEQMYLLLKTVFFACTKTFMTELGYKDFIRVNGQDAASLESAAQGGTFVVFQRNLMYRGLHIDFIAGIDQLARLIQQQFTSTAPPRDETLGPVAI